MAQVFQYPNLASRTYEAEGLCLIGNGIGAIRPTAATDDVVGRYFRFVYPADATDWSYILVSLSKGFGDVTEGTRMALSCFLRLNGEPFIAEIFLKTGSNTNPVAKDYENSYQDVGGGWRHIASKCIRNATDFKSQIFYIWTAPQKAGTTIDVAQPMACVADEPHAWAPAEGEVWPE